MPIESLGGEEQRNIADRRQVATSVWDALAGIGQRIAHRRMPDRAQPYFTDRFSPSTLLLILTLLLLSLLDAVITIRLIPAGCDEVNPLMAQLLEFGVVPFLLGKYFLTAAGLPLLVVFQNFTLFGTRFRVYYLIPLFISLYIALILYQLSLVATLN